MRQYFLSFSDDDNNTAIIIILIGKKYGGGNSTNAKEVSIFQCLFPNPNWLVWKGISPPKTHSNTHGWITGWWQFFHLAVELNLVKCHQRFGFLPWGTLAKRERKRCFQNKRWWWWRICKKYIQWYYFLLPIVIFRLYKTFQYNFGSAPILDHCHSYGKWKLNIARRLLQVIIPPCQIIKITWCHLTETSKLTQIKAATRNSFWHLIEFA